MVFRKNALFAGAVTAVVLVGALYLFSNFFLPKAQETPSKSAEEVLAADSEDSGNAFGVVLSQSLSADSQRPLEKSVTLETEVFTAEFSTAGAALRSLRLKKHFDEDGEPLEMIYPNEKGVYPGVLYFAPGEIEPGVYRLENGSASEVVFSASYRTDGGAHFTVLKRWIFDPDEYLFSLTVEVQGGEGFEGVVGDVSELYALSSGYELGPYYGKLDGRYGFRKYSLHTSEGKGYPKLPASRYLEREGKIDWAAVESRFFTEIMVPAEDVVRVGYDKRHGEDAGGRHEVLFFRSAENINVSRIADSYHFYFGPKRRTELGAYNLAENNSFGLSGMEFHSLIDPGKLLRPFVNIFSAIMRQFYHRIVPNYGIAIIALALIIKLMIFPLTKKSIWTNWKIRTLSGEVRKLKDQYSGNKYLLKEKQAELYGREGVKPLMSMIPLFLHLFVFITLYRLLGTEFDLRRAVFIPGLIPDLSLPDQLAMVNGVAVRLMPIVMLVVTFLQTRFSQPPSQGDRQMILASYAIPVVLFIVLYQMPSGVLLYWISQTVMSIIEYAIVSKRMK